METVLSFATFRADYLEQDNDPRNKIMKKILMLAVAMVFATGLFAEDTLVTAAGETVKGDFVKFENGEVHFKSNDFGDLVIKTENIASLELDEPEEVRVRYNEDLKQQEEATLETRDGKLVVVQDGEVRSEGLDAVRSINETLPNEDPVWTASAKAYLEWTRGNTETFSAGFRFDVKRVHKNHIVAAYGEGHYFEDRRLKRDHVRRRDYAAGAEYHYVFDFGLSLDAFQDFYWNEFAGYHIRSVSRLGASYFFFREADYTLQAGAGVAYVHEDLMFGDDDRGYVGAYAFAQYDHYFKDRDVHVMLRTDWLFDFDIIENVTAKNTAMMEYKWSEYFTFGAVLVHYYDNRPTIGFYRHDFTMTLTLGFQWGGSLF